MSENPDLVRSIFSAWERGDFGSAEWAHPQIEFVLADGPDPGSWAGVPAMAKAARERISAWEDYHFTAEAYRELDDERVLVFHIRSGHGKTSGLEVGPIQRKGAWLFHIRGAQVVRMVGYFDRDHALADLGLEE